MWVAFYTEYVCTSYTSLDFLLAYGFLPWSKVSCLRETGLCKLPLGFMHLYLYFDALWCTINLPIVQLVSFQMPAGNRHLPHHNAAQICRIIGTNGPLFSRWIRIMHIAKSWSWSKRWYWVRGARKALKLVIVLWFFFYFGKKKKITITE